MEAKGATSAREGSARFAAGFESAQVFVHVAEAFYKAAVAATRESELNARAAIALPDDALHRRYTAPIEPALLKLEIGVFWVTSLDRVRWDAPWSLE